MKYKIFSRWNKIFLLERFYAEVKNKDGNDYEPDSLKVTLTALDRHLKNKGYNLSIIRDTEFSSSKQVLEGTQFNNKQSI